ncbi:MAG: trehalose-phosphatase [Planctomycetes bacterium]|nr:trehalose-phosphatase [Planctomycetota bacterium]
MSTLNHWNKLACHTPLGILTDLDGTLIPFAPTPDEARVDPAVSEVLRDLAALPGVTTAVLSGRSRESLERMMAGITGLHLIAEHGGWTKGTGAWQSGDTGEKGAIEEIARQLDRIAARTRGCLIERKTWSVALHLRAIRASEKAETLIEALATIGPWLEAHPGFERIDGAETVEVRPVQHRKSTAVPWLRDHAGPDTRLLALGDDLTDEDLFRALGVGDEAVIVGRDHGRGSAARWRLRDPQSTVRFLRWIVDARREGPTPPPPAMPTPLTRVPRGHPGMESRYSLISVSNRLPHLRSAAENGPDRKRNVGGLVSALETVLAERKGIWLGWSGQLISGSEPGPVTVDDESHPALAWMDLPGAWHQKYYNGLCNQALWPLFHSFATRVHYSEEDWDCYSRVNDAFAQAVTELAGPHTPVWAHDYHLLLLARGLRRHGHKGPMGCFLHIPFPGADIFSILPRADALLDALLDFDLLGFHTPGHVDNFRQCVGALSPANVSDDLILHRGRRIRVGAFPIGIIPGDFQETQDPSTAEEISTLLGPFSGTRLILGVDRLDYTKGIPERLLAFGRLLELFPEWRTKVSFLQVSVPSREDIPEYAEQRARVETIVGRINGEHGEASWVPIRYLYRSYGRDQLAQLYRAAEVGCVTPLRDGMNLVAKEYVAAQNPERPGVLLLSSFAGAARELRDALITNPWHIDGMTRDLDRALRMPMDERRERHSKLFAAVSRTTAATWAEDFLSMLEACRSGAGEERAKVAQFSRGV